MDILSTKNQEIDSNSKQLINHFDIEIQSYKGDYRHLLKILKEKEEEILFLKDTIDQKEDKIAALHDKLLSVVVLEHKIQELDKKSKNDLEKTNKEWIQKVKEIENARSYSPNLFRRINNYETNQRKLENSLIVKDLINRKVLDKKKLEINKTNFQNSQLCKSLNSVRHEKERLKTDLVEKNKEIFALEKRKKMLFFGKIAKIYYY